MITTTKTKGLQKGHTGADKLAKTLDKQCRKQRDVLFKELKVLFPELTMQKKLTKEQIKGGIGACQPDGGSWFYKDKLIAIVEAKKQQDKGNAVERWFKNHFICRSFNPDVTYVTFGAGKGAYFEGKLHFGIAPAHTVIDRLLLQRNSLFLSVEGFTDDEVYTIMKRAIIKSIELLNDHD